MKTWEFPGVLVVRTPHFHCRGRSFSPWSGNLISHILHCMAQNKKKHMNPQDFPGGLVAKMIMPLTEES